jgi:hypothetical protein
MNVICLPLRSSSAIPYHPAAGSIPLRGRPHLPDDDPCSSASSRSVACLPGSSARDTPRQSRIRNGPRCAMGTRSSATARTGTSPSSARTTRLRRARIRLTVRSQVWLERGRAAHAVLVVAADQNVGIADQLKLGARMLQAQAHINPADKTIHFCHTDCVSAHALFVVLVLVTSLSYRAHPAAGSSPLPSALLTHFPSSCLTAARW